MKLLTYAEFELKESRTNLLLSIMWLAIQILCLYSIYFIRDLSIPEGPKIAIAIIITIIGCLHFCYFLYKLFFKHLL